MSIPILKRWVGTPGTLMVVRDMDRTSQWKILPDTHHDTSEPVEVVVDSAVDVPTGTKRPHSPTVNDGPDMKKIRPLDGPFSSNCLAPRQNTVALRVLDNPGRMTELSTGTGDLFLTEGFRDRWCRCTDV
jgi:E3 ubiquitin-protein ligase UBR7